MLRAAGDAHRAERAERSRVAAFLAAVQIDSNPFRKKGTPPTDPAKLFDALMRTKPTPTTPPAETKDRLRSRFDLDQRFPDLFPGATSGPPPAEA